MDADEAQPDFANNPPPLYPGLKKGRAVPGQIHEVDGVCVRRDKEIFHRLGVIDKGNGCGVAVYVSHWRGVTRLEIHEMERMQATFSRTSVRVFISPTHIDELIKLLQLASDFARSLPAPAKRKVAVRKQTQLNARNKPNENE